MQIEYVSNHDEMAADPAFAEVLDRFQSAESLLNPMADAGAEAGASSSAAAAADADEPEQPEAEVVSKKKKKLQKRLSVAELKQLVHKPEVVEQWDVTAADPRLLVLLKSYRNVVPVPKHWCQKRHFLMGKRGVEKPPFKLPEFIEATGIAKIRAAVMEREAGKKLKGKQKERVQPKMGKIDIDYQVLHDAFFKYQTKPVRTAAASSTRTRTRTCTRAPGTPLPRSLHRQHARLALRRRSRRTATSTTKARSLRWRCARRGRVRSRRSCARGCRLATASHHRGSSTCSATARRRATPASRFRG